MPRHLLRAFASSVYLLIGLAGLLAASGCAGSPAMNTISGLLKPQTAQSGSAPPDIFSSIAQRLGIAPATHHPAANAGATQTDTTSGTSTDTATDTTTGTTAGTATAAK